MKLLLVIAIYILSSYLAHKMDSTIFAWWIGTMTGTFALTILNTL